MAEGKDTLFGISDLITVLKNMVGAANTINQTISKVFLQTIGDSPTATSGSETLPSNPAGFIEIFNPVTSAIVKVPYYNP